MAPLQFLLVLFLSSLASSAQNPVPQKSGEHYLVVEIRATDEGSSFEFEGVHLSRTGKECVLERIEGKAPFKISLQNATYLILRGKSGEGKVGFKYKVEKEEKRSMQYISAGEALVIDFLPMGALAGPGTHWSDGKMFGRLHELSVTSLTKE